jgi:hypothetical protein
MRRLVVLAVLPIYLAACSTSATPTPQIIYATPAPTPQIIYVTQAPTPTSSPCIDRAAYGLHLNAAVHALQALPSAGPSNQVNLAKWVSGLRLAASETTSMADAVEPAEPEAAKHYRRAAVALDSAATSMSQGLYGDVTGWLNQNVNEGEQAAALIKSSDYCQ